MDNLNALELAVLEKLFEGSNPALSVLREQTKRAKVISRRLSGVGFFTSFELPKEQRAATVSSTRIRFGDVGAKIEGLTHGAGFLVYVDDGMLTALEGYTYDEPWPEQLGGFEIHCLNPNRPSLETVFGA